MLLIPSDCKVLRRSINIEIIQLNASSISVTIYSERRNKGRRRRYNHFKRVARIGHIVMNHNNFLPMLYVFKFNNK